MKRKACWLGLVIIAAVLLSCGRVEALVVGMEDFDGGTVNLISGFNPAVDNRDGGAGDFFGVGSRAAWPQGFPPGIPFSIADDSVVSVSDPANAPFPTDNEGLFGQNRAPNDKLFVISDTRDFEAAGQPTASWTFNIGNVPKLNLYIDMGAQASESSGGFPTSALVTFDYQIDGGPLTNAFTIAPRSDVGSFTYRAMDSGVVPAIGANGPLHVSGPTFIGKYLAGTGLSDNDKFLNKTPASGLGAGKMDTFSVPIAGTGSQLVLTMTANLDFEAMAFDNIKLIGIPEPASIVLLAVVGVAGMMPRRRRRK